jgi:hypothetical protein
MPLNSRFNKIEAIFEGVYEVQWETTSSMVNCEKLFKTL